MSLEGSICFLVVYRYESNAILALPISGFSDKAILRAYKEIYEMIELKGFIIRFIVMDNQASKVINKFLTHMQCELMLAKLPRGTLDVHRRSDHIKVDVEQRIKHGGCKVHVFGH